MCEKALNVLGDIIMKKARRVRDLTPRCNCGDDRDERDTLIWELMNIGHTMAKAGEDNYVPTEVT